jgi:hypothetical protein
MMNLSSRWGLRQRGKILRELDGAPCGLVGEVRIVLEYLKLAQVVSTVCVEPFVYGHASPFRPSVHNFFARVSYSFARARRETAIRSLKVGSPCLAILAPALGEIPAFAVCPPRLLRTLAFFLALCTSAMSFSF